MAHAIGVRATSFVASAALLGLAVVAGLTMTIVQREIMHIDEGRPVDIVEAPRPEEPPPPRESRPPVRPVDDTAIAPIEPLTPFDMSATPTSSSDWVATPPPQIVNPQWVRRPRDLARYYPPRALGRGVEGRVVLDCAVTTRGALNCDVVSETPANWGFAEAAVRISRDHQMVPAMRDGVAVEGRHRMVIPFEVH